MRSLALAFLLLAVPALASVPTALSGSWKVDLRPRPDAPEYYKTMQLTVAADGTLSGSFYDSEILAGRASTSNGRSCFAFRTTDGKGYYHTSGCLDGERVVGQTWAEDRGFVLAWTAVRLPGAGGAPAVQPLAGR